MIAGMLSNKKLNPLVTKLYFRGRKLKIYLVFIKKFKTNKNFNKLCLIIYQILVLKTS